MPQEIILVLVSVINIYTLVLLARIILSWVRSADRSNPIVHFIYQITDPVLEPVRQLIPPIGGTLDLSPIIVFVALRLLKAMLLSMGHGI